MHADAISSHVWILFQCCSACFGSNSKWKMKYNIGNEHEAVISTLITADTIKVAGSA